LQKLLNQIGEKQVSNAGFDANIYAAGNIYCLPVTIQQ